MRARRRRSMATRYCFTAASRRLTKPSSPLLLVQRSAQLFRRDADVDAGAFLLQRHRHPEIALDPAALDGSRELIQHDLADRHRHAHFARELEPESSVLVRK